MSFKLKGCFSAIAVLMLSTTAIAANNQSALKKVTYIVELNPQVSAIAQMGFTVARGHGGLLQHTYTRAMRGFAVQIPASAENAFVTAMRLNPLVSLVEKEQLVQSSVTTQTNAPWGLDRIDQRNLPLDRTYNADAQGAGSTIFVVDTGILATHNELVGRVSTGYTSINDGRGSSDCNGHGTHVAGTAAGKTYGVAKAATVVPVRVLDCNGSGGTAGVIAGIDWAIGQARPRAVLNLSLGGTPSTAMDNAITRATNAGIVAVVAAGNENANSCNYSPARAASAITVGATTNNDTRASYSNFGRCVDVFAPGSGIMSAWFTNNTAVATLNGTSMASPHVAGLAAILRSVYTGESATQISNRVINSTTPNLVKSAGSNSPNRLLYSRLDGSSNAPVASQPSSGGSSGGLLGLF